MDIEKISPKTCLIDIKYVHTIIKRRKEDIHKGDCGRVLIVAGSKGMAGAAVLSVKGALRSGAGLVTVSVPEELIGILQVSVPEAMCMSREKVIENISEFDSIVIGPGLGSDDDGSILEMIQKILLIYEGNIVLDADGLNAIAGNPSILKKSKAKGIVLTPHPGEAARLLNIGAKEINQDREGFAAALSRITDATIVLKGSGTVVATQDKRTYINITGNPGMATGGMGDVLSGIIASLTGQDLSAEEAAVAGVFLHGLSGDIMAEKDSEYSLIASDVAKGLGSAIRKVLDYHE